jgi:hypothetical protein
MHIHHTEWTSIGQTAEVVLKYHPGVILHELEELRERVGWSLNKHRPPELTRVNLVYGNASGVEAASDSTKSHHER